MVRFFAVPPDFCGNSIRLSDEDAAHIRSLRLRPGEFFVVCDGAGTDHICRLGERDGGSVAEIVRTSTSLGEPSVACSVYIAFAKGDRLDYAVQKSVELGAHDIVLFPSERCVAVPGDPGKKIARLQRITLETAKQCGRGRVPELSAVGSFGEAVKQAAMNSFQSTPNVPHCGTPNQPPCEKPSGLSLFFYECEEKLHLKEVLERSAGAVDTVSIVTGPEGGFAPHEAELAQAEGLIAVSLGSRILRCETAPVAALAAIMFYTGNL